jgi:hypothetical protein
MHGTVPFQEARRVVSSVQCVCRIGFIARSSSLTFLSAWGAARYTEGALPPIFRFALYEISVLITMGLKTFGAIPVSWHHFFGKMRWISFPFSLRIEVHHSCFPGEASGAFVGVTPKLIRERHPTSLLPNICVVVALPVPRVSLESPSRRVVAGESYTPTPTPIVVLNQTAVGHWDLPRVGRLEFFVCACLRRGGRNR